jgi:hypothetical protein
MSKQEATALQVAAGAAAAAAAADDCRDCSHDKISNGDSRRAAAYSARKTTAATATLVPVASS